MKISDFMSNFLITNKELLEEDRLTELFHTAYNGLEAHRQEELVNILEHVGVDTLPAREAVIRFVITMLFEDLVKPVYLRDFINLYVDGTLGFTFDWLFDYIMNNESEWDVDLKIQPSGLVKVFPRN